MSLIQFAYDVAQSSGGDLASLYRQVAQVVRDGYVSARDDSEFSIVAVPVLWPEEVQRVNTAGAGDTVSAILAYFFPLSAVWRQEGAGDE